MAEMHKALKRAAARRSGRTAEEVQSCRSEEGKTVGLIDAIIAINRFLCDRDLSTKNVQDALADLLEDEDFRTIREARQTN